MKKVFNKYNYTSLLVIFFLLFFNDVRALASDISTDKSPTDTNNDLQPTHLKIVGAWGFLSQYKNFEYPFWNKTVPENSNGKITTEITPFNEMGLKGTEILRLMKLGLIDFGSTVLAYGPESDVPVEGIDLAGLNPEIETARAVVNAYFPVMQDFYETRHNVKVLAIWPYPAQIVWCKDPLSNLSDLSGRKIRVGTRPVGEFVEGLGGVSVNVPFGEAHAAIKTGSIDCAVTGALPGNTAKWFEVTDYLYPLPLGWSMAMSGVNLDTWQKLDPDVQDFLQNGINDLSDQIWAVADDETMDGIRCNTGQTPCQYGIPASMTLVDISKQDISLKQKVLENVVLKRWAERCSAACVTNWNNTIGQVLGLKAIK